METLLFRATATILLALIGVTALPPLETQKNGQSGHAGEITAMGTVYVPLTIPVVTTPPLQATISGCQDALDLAVKVGWPLEEMGVLANVLWRESRCTNQYPDGRLVHNPNDPKGGSWCAMQLNGAHFERTDWSPRGWMAEQNIGVRYPADLRNAELCLRAALALYQYAERAYGDGWQPWTATRGW